jgi:hypothetical protein
MANYEDFARKLGDLTARFAAQEHEMRRKAYDEATLRLEYLDPMFGALGWNVWNDPPQPLHLRDVVVENRVEGRGHSGKADYVFRTAGLERWVCEAKRPFETIERHYFQVQNYTYNMRLWLGALCSFDHLVLFVVGGRPSKDRPFSPVPGWRLHYSNYAVLSRKIWDLLSNEAVQAGSIERFIQSLGKVPTKERQGWLVKPDRTKTVDARFLEFLEDQRRRFAKDIVKGNPAIDWIQASLAECLQDVFDRILVQRISEDRGIDVGRSLYGTVQEWHARGKVSGQLWPMMTANFRHLAATFNGGVYGRPNDNSSLADRVHISDGLLAEFVDEVAGDESEWLFGTMPLWLIGSVYERFLGSEVRPNGVVELKPETRKAGGVYYTPEPVVRAVIDRTLGEALAGLTPADVLNLRVIDPACGSGSFLLAAFDRMLDHCLDYYMANPGEVSSDVAFPIEDKLLLTTSFKRRLLTSCIYGVDIDPVAVKVAQMSLCLRVLEDETQEALAKEQALFPRQTFLPDLDENIIHANSLIPVSAFPNEISLDCLEGSNPVDWDALLTRTKKRRGFDVVIGNPPWGADVSSEIEAYLKKAHRTALVRMPDTYIYFTHISMETLLKPGGILGMVLPGTLLNQSDARSLREYLLKQSVEAVADLGAGIFGDALNTTSIVIVRKGKDVSPSVLLNDVSRTEKSLKETNLSKWIPESRDRWLQLVNADSATTFFVGRLEEARALIDARTRFGVLADLIDEYGIQRGVTPDFKGANIIDESDAIQARIESSVLRNSLRGEDVRAFTTAPATVKIIYTTDSTDPASIPRAIAYLSGFRSMMTCSEVKRGTHPWWRLHRARSAAIFDRKKFIGITTSRNISLCWDDGESLVVTDAMYVFSPKKGIPKDYIWGIMQSEAFARFYSISNQGDARVIPQIKATKLGDVPIPAWNGNDQVHVAIVSTVQALSRLAGSSAPGADRTYQAQLRQLHALVEQAYSPAAATRREE